MEQHMPRPDTIQALRWGADAAFAMLAGMQLDLFTALQSGAQTPPQLAAPWVWTRVACGSSSTPSSPPAS
jgi:hypothetical protein